MRPVLFVTAGVAIAAATALVVAASLYEMRVDAFARARDTSENLCVILQRDIERNFEVYELLIQNVADNANRPDVLHLPPELRQRVLFNEQMNAQDMGAILVTDANGQVVIDSRAMPPLPLISAIATTFKFNSSRPGQGSTSASPLPRCGTAIRCRLR